MRINEITDTLKLPSINIGDEVRVGKFKNRKAVVKGFDKDEHNHPVLKTTKGDQKLFKPRISKLMKVEEGYKLQLERDTDMMVLHITDTDTGKRTEVRGKPGYETNGYDANDKLHQLLDKISKTANISELMNGEPVGINPKHPDGASAKTATTQAFNESLDNPYSYYWDDTYNGDDSFLAKAEMDMGELMVMFSVGEPGVSWTIDFAVDGSMDKTGDGDQFRIFATVVAVIKDWMANKVDLSKVTQIDFSSDKGGEAEDSRAKLYKRFGQQLASKLGWNLEVTDRGQFASFKIKNPDAPVTENFADGKVKGKSRPGRVKRSGASCNGSVTELRAKAKKASGEKAKMYHWCANMKSGRK